MHIYFSHSASAAKALAVSRSYFTQGRGAPFLDEATGKVRGSNVDLGGMTPYDYVIKLSTQKNALNDLSIYDRAELILSLSAQIIDRSLQVKGLKLLYQDYKSSKQRRENFKDAASYSLAELKKRLRLDFLKEKWQNWPPKYKLNVFRELISIQRSFFGYEPPVKVEIADKPLQNKRLAEHDMGQNTIFIDKQLLASVNPKYSMSEILACVFHEGTHALQMCQSDTFFKGGHFDKNNSADCDAMMLCVQRYPHAYIREDEDRQGYDSNINERDADFAGSCFRNAFENPISGA
jgi:hypothetical protein